MGGRAGASSHRQFDRQDFVTCDRRRGLPTTVDNERAEAFRNAIEGSGMEHGNWNRDDAFEVTQDFLSRHAGIDAVRAIDDMKRRPWPRDRSRLGMRQARHFVRFAMPPASSFVPPMRPAPAIRFRATDRARRAVDGAMALDPTVLARMFTAFDADRIMAEAERIDRDETRRNGPLAGVTISIKDLFDEAGVTTTAGSAILLGGPAAMRDAEAVRRLKAAGAISCGRTTMSEFAYSGVGLNPHYGDPGNAFDPARISGGSSSGGGLSVALGVTDAALGSDTGGSVRIPAALNGLCGFKPTQSAVPLDGSFPLSTTFDSIGPLAPTMAACAAIHAVLSASRPQAGDVTPARPRIGVVTGLFMDGLDAQVAGDYAAALEKLAADCELVEIGFPFLDGFGDVNRVIVANEAYAFHRERLEALRSAGDQRVLKRILAAENFDESDIAEAHARRARAMADFAAAAAGFDGFVAPTLPTVAPLIADVAADFDRLNALMLRNPSALNFLDGCAATVPMQGDQTLTTGMMIFGPGGWDWRIIALARRIEAVLS